MFNCTRVLCAIVLVCCGDRTRVHGPRGSTNHGVRGRMHAGENAGAARAEIYRSKVVQSSLHEDRFLSSGTL
jgi:hypothetical protein